MTADRRQEPRREEDRVVDLRLDRLEEIVNKFEATLQTLGSAVGHLTLVDARTDDNLRRITEVEHRMQRVEQDNTEVRINLEGLKTRVLFICALGSLLGSGVVGVLVAYAH